MFSFIIFSIISAGVYCKYFYPSAKTFNKTPLSPGSISDSIVVWKSERKLSLYYDNKLLKSYHISLGDNPVGHKEKEGDEKTPEGLYKISGRNPISKYHLSLRISYPNENDKKNADFKGYSPGGDIMIHGLPHYSAFLENYYVNNDWTDGCIAVTNEEIEELWEAVKDGTPILINK